MKCLTGYWLVEQFILKWILKNWKNKGLVYKLYGTTYQNLSMDRMKKRIMNKASLKSIVV